MFKKCLFSLSVVFLSVVPMVLGTQAYARQCSSSVIPIEYPVQFVGPMVDWRPQDFQDSQGITAVCYDQNQASLVLNCNLAGHDSTLSKGEVELDLNFTPTIEQHVPVDMTGRQIIVEINVPAGLIGSPSAPNGAQVFVKDDKFRPQYGTWVNLVNSGKAIISLEPSTATPLNGYTEPGFDPTRIRIVGLKIGINNSSAHQYMGPLKMTGFEIIPPLPSTTPPDLPEDNPVPFLKFDSTVTINSGSFYADGTQWFISGGNWRLIDYGQNFGITKWFPKGNGVSIHQGYLAAKLWALKKAGVSLVRVGLMDDGRTLLDLDGNVSGYNDIFQEDVSTFLDLATQYDMKVEFTLVDFLIAGKEELINGVWVRGRREIIEDSDVRYGFITNFLVPFLNEYGSHPALFGIDLINEPEWIISKTDGGGWEDVSDEISKAQTPIAIEEFRKFVQDCSDRIHQLAPGKFVTVGVSMKNMALLAGLDLDYYALHYYPWMGDLSSYIQNINTDKPWILEEFPGNADLSSYLGKVFQNSGAGALVWNLSPGIDDQTYSFDEEEEKLQDLRSFVESISDACSYSISPTTQSFSSSGGPASFNVSVSGTGCNWSATSGDNWINITSGGGLGSGIVEYTVSNNDTGHIRQGTVTAEGLTFNIKQAESEFGDVLSGYWAYDFIYRMYIEGITAGCGSANFCPDNSVSRMQMAVFLLKALGEAPAAACTGIFGDVSVETVGNTFCRYVEKFSTLGITAGCGGGNYCPNDPVTRGQMAVFITKALGETMAATCDRTFNDVDETTGGNSAFCRFIEKFSTLGITAGCGGGNYCPDSPVTRAQMAVFITKGFLGQGGADPTAGMLKGTVLDINKYPVPGTRVDILNEQISVITDSDGKFTATIAKGQQTIEVFIDNLKHYGGSVYCEANSANSVTINTSYSLWTTVTPQYVVVDDYSAVSLPNRDWYYSRIGTDRGEMMNGTAQFNVGGGLAEVNVDSGWGGVWTSLIHTAASNDELNPTALLGPYVRRQYQPYVTGIALDLRDGSGLFKVELKDINDQPVSVKEFNLSGGRQTLIFQAEPDTGIKFLNWLVDGKGGATVEKMRLIVASPSYLTPEAVFLFSFGHLSQCYESSSGLVRDRARWPVEDFSSVQTIGTFALTTAIAMELGYIEENIARDIIINTRNAILSLPTYHGLLPHFVTDGHITENTEWSTVDTAIALISQILACEAIGEDTSQLEAIMKNIDWEDLTDSGNHSISHGYNYAGNKLTGTWDTFGSESFLVAAAYSAATGKADVRLDNYSYPPTWDGSGFNDELAALFFPMKSMDKWGNNWAVHRQEAFQRQAVYFSGHHYEGYGLFGLSASEVPEPWTVNENQVYAAWGVGGHNGMANDGIFIVGYPIVAPHYAAMVAKEHPLEFESVFRYLIENHGVLTPLNNVESLGIDNGGNLRWNSLKGSWNLSLQLLGVSRVLSKGDYLPYRVLSENDFLHQGYKALME